MSTELVEINKESAMTVFTQEEGLDSYVKQVANEVASFDHNMKTAASRGRTISLASKVAKIKVMYDNCGKDLVSGWKESAKKVDASRKKMRDQLDELRVLARKPVTDWEAEQAEIEKQRLAKVEADRLAAEKLNDHEVAVLLDEKFNRDLADAKLKAEAEQKAEDQRLEDVRIANNARIASEAKLEAEALAKKTIDDANKAKQQAIDDKAKADKDLLESEARAKLLKEQAEQHRLNNEWLAYINEAYETNSKIDQSKLAAIAAKQAALDAVEREKSKVAHAAAVEAAAVEARRKDEVNNRLIHRAIYGGFIDAGLSKEEATKATQAIIDSAIPHITINY